MNVKNIIKTVVFMLISVSAIVFTGCGDPKIEAFLKTDITNAMAARVNANKAIVQKLKTSGLLSDTEAKTIEQNIDEQMNVYTKGDLANNTELQEKLLAAIVDWNAPAFDASFGYKDEKEWNNELVTNYMRDISITKHMKVPLFKGKKSNVVPISIIDDKTAEMVHGRFGYKVYVLKPFSGSGDGKAINSQKSLDEMLEMVKTATTNKDKIDNSVMDQLFQKAVDENGKDVTLVDLTKRKNRVAGNSIGSPHVTDTTYKLVKGELKVDAVGNKVKKDLSPSKQGFETPIVEAEPGKDMVIKDKTGQIPLLAVRFNEFNNEAVDNIIKTLGMSPDQYLFTTYNGENRVYIMEYPVHYIEKIKEDAKDVTKYACEFAQSNMGLNLRTGKLIKYGKAWGKDTEPGVYFEDSDPYLPVKGAKNAQEEGRSAFALEGETPDKYRLEIGENKSKVKTGRIILRDYLEATYAPGIVSGENLVVFGRKLRILQFSGSKANVIAKYYDKDGKVLDKSPSLFIDDFADFDALNASNASVKYIGRVGEATTPDDGKTPPADGKAPPADNKTPTADDKTQQGNGEEGEDFTTSGIQSSISKIEELDTSVVKEIAPAEQFPGTKLGVADNTASNKPLFYAMVVKKNMFETALFSDWINNTEPTKNSLPWWESWLGGTTRKYEYSINRTSLEEYLMGNYTFELQEAGIVILDLETISKIQKEYSEQDKIDSMRTFRTTFVVLGWLLISYSFVLIIAWVLDTNVDFGIDLLEKLTFGHWIAIKDREEMPISDLGERRYVTFRDIVMRAILMSTVGVILILVNIIDVALYLIQMFGGIAKVISNVILGK